VTDRPWSDFESVDTADDPDYYRRYLDELWQRGDTRDYKLRSYERLELLYDSAVLDVGTGVGRDALELARAIGPAGRVVGVDRSASLLDEARRRAEAAGLKCKFELADADKLPFAEGEFDAARGDRLFLYLEDPFAVLREMARVVRPGGVVWARDPDMATFLIDGSDAAITRAIADYFSDSFPNGWSGRRFWRLFHETGLTEVQYVPRTLLLPTLKEADALFGIGRTVAGAVDSGAVDADQAATWFEELRALDADGGFVFSLTFFETWGRVPRE
jgi:ubiquinone/menaquinone biosynthesis C-methylase UbiE